MKILQQLCVFAILGLCHAAKIPSHDDDSQETTTELTQEPSDDGAVTSQETTTELTQEPYNDDTEGGFKGHSLIEVRPMTSEALEFLRDLDNKVPDDVLDFWSEPAKTEEPVPVLVHPELLKPVEDAFKANNLTYSIKIKDFQQSIDEEMQQIEAESDSGLIFRDPTNRLVFDLYNYHKLDEINAYLAATEKSKADLVADFNLHTIATTYEGRPIQYVSIKSHDQSKRRAAVFMDCGIHAREWVSPAFCLYAIDRLLDHSNLDLIDKFDFYIMPVGNPDGYVYTWNKNRMWRKNRRPSNNLPKLRRRKQFWNPFPSGIPALGGAQYPAQSQHQSKCVGTDPNRNFNIYHGRSGSSSDPCQDTFHGDSPFSEVESRAIRDIINQLDASYGKDRIAAYVSVHAFSQYWMSPNGHIKERPKDYKDHMRVASAAVNALSKRFQTSYEYGPINEVIYEASGSSVDWAYSNAGVKYSYALELRDQGQNGFMLPVNQIKPTLEETWAGIRAMCDEISKEFPPQ